MVQLILVTGAGGFVGGHLVKRLLAEGHEVRAADVKVDGQWHQWHEEAHNWDGVDLADPHYCEAVCDEVEVVYNLAADMGGMGFIESNKALCMLSVLISTNMLVAARDAGVERFFYSSSACVYPGRMQNGEANTDPTRNGFVPARDGLREDDAYPADPEDGYGWEKLFSERMARHFYEDFGLETRVARYHNVYGPRTSYKDGREKAPAAICRKVAAAVLLGTKEIEVWGDGKQIRSFTYVDDAVEGTLRLTASDVREPLNVGSDRWVTIDGLIDIVEEIAGVKLERRYDTSAPQGVRGRNSDNLQIQKRLGWAPSVELEDGMEATYRWVYDRMKG